MPAYNFKARFAAQVENYTKRQTIRPHRKNQPRVGQAAYLYTGMRTRQCRLLGTGHIKAVVNISIMLDDSIFLNGERLGREAALELAQADGFPSTEKLVDFFRQQYGLPFQGMLIKW